MANGVVVTGSKNTASSLDRDGVRRIFLGREQGAVVVFSNSPVRAAFESSVLDKSPSEFKSLWSRLVFTGRAKVPKERSTDAEVKSFLALSPSAYGYMHEDSVDSTVKVVYRF